MPLHCPKIKSKSKEKNIKSRKIDKRKRKMLVSKCTITATRLCLAKLLMLFTLKVSLYVLMLGESSSIILLFKGAIF